MQHLELIDTEFYCRSRKLRGYITDSVSSLHALISLILALRTNVPIVRKPIIYEFKTLALGNIFEEQNSQVFVCLFFKDLYRM